MRTQENFDAKFYKERFNEDLQLEQQAKALTDIANEWARVGADHVTIDELRKRAEVLRVRSREINSKKSVIALIQFLLLSVLFIYPWAIGTSLLFAVDRTPSIVLDFIYKVNLDVNYTGIALVLYSILIASVIFVCISSVALAPSSSLNQSTRE